MVDDVTRQPIPPAGTPASTPAPVPYTPIISGAAPAGGGDPAFAAAQGNLAPNAPLTQDQWFQKLYAQSQSVIDAISARERAAESAASIASTQESKANDFSLNAAGLAGSSEANSMAAQNEEKRQAAVDQALANKTTDLANLTSTIASQAINLAQADQTRSDTNSANYIASKIAQGQSWVKALATQGHTLDDVKNTDPNTYATMLQYFNGDENAMRAQWISDAAPISLDGGKPIQAGTSLIFTFQDPVTKKTFVQSVDAGVPLSSDWTSAKAADGSIYMVNKLTGETKQLGGGDPYFLANKALTDQVKQQSLKNSAIRDANSLLRSSGLLTGSGGSGVGGSIPARFNAAASTIGRIQAAASTGSNAVSDEDIIDALVQINTGGGKPSQAQFDQITSNFGFQDKAGIAYNKYINNSSSFLPKGIKDDAIALAKANFQSLAKQKKAWDSTAQDLLNKNGISGVNVSTDSSFLNPPAPDTSSAATGVDVGTVVQDASGVPEGTTGTDDNGNSMIVQDGQWVSQ